MPIAETAHIVAAAEVIETDLAAVDAAIVGLPVTPLEADLPDIVQIVADLSAATESMRVVVAQVLTLLSTTRINQ